MPNVSRRQALKLASAGAIGLANRALRSQKPQQNGQSVPVWQIFEATFQGPTGGNPFRDVHLSATFSFGSREVDVEGFYDGEGRYKVRFMPDAPGAWTFTTHCNEHELDGRVGEFSSVAAKPDAHGPVRVARTSHFEHVDGTPYYPFGTTCYAWIHQSEALQSETLETLRSAPFNKIRMCVFPKSYEYNHNEPALYPFERSHDGKSDFAKPNPAFYAHLERRILDLQRLGIEADLILFHPYDRWGYATMSAEDDDAYLRYVLARLSSCRNIWWSMANEFDLMKTKTAADFDRLFQLVTHYDAFNHLRSVHYSKTMYNYGHPWVTHASLQNSNFSSSGEYRRDWNKPIVFDEVGYEGNLNRRWGCMSSAEMIRKFWVGVISGSYVTHGECYLDNPADFREDSTPTLWWSHGGKLHGDTAKRVGFLKQIIEDTAPSNAHRIGWDPTPDPYYLNAVLYDTAGSRAETVLYYFDSHQPIWYQFPLPEGQFTAEYLDPDAGTISPIGGRFSGKPHLTLTGKPYQGVRFRRVS